MDLAKAEYLYHIVLVSYRMPMLASGREIYHNTVITEEVPTAYIRYSFFPNHEHHATHEYSKSGST
jgi:hypothetical protein